MTKQSWFTSLPQFIRTAMQCREASTQRMHLATTLLARVQVSVKVSSAAYPRS